MAFFFYHEQAFQAETDTDPCIRNSPGGVQWVWSHGGGTGFYVFFAGDHIDSFAVDSGFFRFQGIGFDPGGVHDEGGEFFEVGAALVFGKTHFHEVEHGEFGTVLGTLGLFAETGADFENADGFFPQAEEVFEEVVQVGGEHGAEAFVFFEPVDLGEEGVFFIDGHFGQQAAGHDGGGGDLDEVVGGEGFDESGFEAAEVGAAVFFAELVQEVSGGFDEFGFEFLEGLVALGGIFELHA